MAAVPPASWSSEDLRAQAGIETLAYPSLDLEKLAFEDDLNEALGKPPRFAVARAVSRSPIRNGEWIDTPDGLSIWKLRVSAEDAVNLNFGFNDVELPAGARLYIYSAAAEKRATMDRFQVLGPFGPEINEEHRQFWTPLLETDEAVIELNVPTRLRDRVSLELIQVSQGYRGFGQAALGYRQSNFGIGEGKSTECDGKTGEGGARSGSCNMDVACLAPDDPWNDPRRSVGAMFVGGTSTCTGSLVNNTANDRRMLFMTATHCGLTASSAPSLVVYWNYEWPTCRTPGEPEGGQVNPPDPTQANSGATFLAATENPFSGCSTPGNCSDVTLLELDDPADPALDLFWSGWDRRDLVSACGPQGSNSSTAGLCASIHHPGVDEKRITFVESDIQVGNISGAQGVHWHPFWDPTPPVVAGIPDPQPSSIPPGVTEPGSSGSPLYNADQRFIGVLSGGPAFCGATGSQLSDFYGQLAHAWDGLGTPTTRMRDHLDPLGTNPGFIDGIGASPFRLAATPATVAACTTEGSLDIVIDVEADEGFNEDVTLAVSGVPAGVTDSLSVNPVTPPGSSTLTLGSLGSAMAGTYLVGVQGTAPGEDPLDLSIPLELSSQIPVTTHLVAPADGALNVSSTPLFSWSESAQTSTYLLEIASDAGFSNVLVAETVSGANTSFEPSSPLPTSTQLFWRVTPSNQCGTAEASAIFSFTTASAPGDCSPGTAAQLYFSDNMENGANGWTTVAGSGFGVDTWAQDGSDGNSGSNSWRGLDVAVVGDQQLISPEIVVPAGVSPLTLQYYGKRDMEEDGPNACFDGGVLEYSTDGGSNWIPVDNARLDTNPYTGPLDDGFQNPLAGRDAWCGTQDWTRTVVDLTGLDGETLQFRFRLATDSSVAADDWHIDDVRVQSCIIVQEELFADGFESPPMAP